MSFLILTRDARIVKGIISSSKCIDKRTSVIIVSMKKILFIFLTLSFVPFHWAEAQSIKPVDLGLSVQWATCDLGATSPEEDGYRYAWGDITPKTDIKDDSSSSMRISVSKKYHTVDNKTQLDLSDDAAYHELGENWRIPTKEECDELLANCKYKRTTKNGVSGYLFVSKKNGKSIFFADSRTYWTASLYTKGAQGGQVYYEAWTFVSGNEYWVPDRATELNYNRSTGRRMPVRIRPVYDPRNVSSQQSTTQKNNSGKEQVSKTTVIWATSAGNEVFKLYPDGTADVNMDVSYRTKWEQDDDEFIFIGGSGTVKQWMLDSSTGSVFAVYKSSVTQTPVARLVKK